MKKILLLVICCIALSSFAAPAFAAPILADSAPTYGFATLNCGNGMSASVLQSFTAKYGTLDSASFLLSKSGAPSGSIQAVLWKHVGTYGVSSLPMGYAPIAVSNLVDVSALSTQIVPQRVTFAFDNTLVLDADANYLIGVRYDGGDIDNHVDVGRAASHDGNAVLYWTGAPSGDLTPGNWIPRPYDVAFWVYENAIVPVPVQTGTNVDVAPIQGVSITFKDVTQAGSITAVPSQNPASSPSGFTSGGIVYDITPTGVGFSGEGFDITIPYTVGTVDPKLFHHVNGRWDNITTSVDPVNHTVTGHATSFSDFGVFGSADPVPTPASSPWSLALAALVALILAGFAFTRTRAIAQ